MTVTTTPSSTQARTLVDDLLRRGVVRPEPTLFTQTAPLSPFGADVDSVTRNGQLAPALQRDVQGFLKSNPEHPLASARPAEVSRLVAAELDRRGTTGSRLVRGDLSGRAFAGEPRPTDWSEGGLGGIIASLGELVANTMDDLERAAKRASRPERPSFVKPVPHELTDLSEFAVADAEGAPAADGQRYHAGKDWFAPGGTAVRSPIDGKVVEVTPSSGSSGQIFGGTVKIEGENGRVWAFRHVDPKDLDVGQRVKAGDRVASITEWQDGPSHAHIELWKSLEGGYTFENMIDPMTKLKRFL